METQNSKTVMENLSEYLELVNQKLKGHNSLSKTQFMLLKRVKKQLEKQINLLHSGIVNDSAITDLCSGSVLPLSLKKSRYLRNQDGYFNKFNLLCAIYQDKIYVLKVKGSQIEKQDLTTLKIYISKTVGYNVVMSCDNRHKGEIRAYKSQTQVIERLFSRIKKPIYKNLKGKQEYKDGKIYTNISYEELENLYVSELRKLNATLINF